MEAQSIYSLINFSMPLSTKMTTGSLSNKTNSSYQAFATAEGLFICHSDPNTGIRISENNYRYNFGGSTPYAGATQPASPLQITDVSRGNGAFTIGRAYRAKDIPDGLSKTVFFSERTKGSLKPNSSNTEVPTIDDVMTSPNRGSLTMNPLTDPDKMLADCAKYSSGVQTFMQMGRWDTENPFNGNTFTDGWPIGSYASTMYNHVAPPNWSGQDCGNTSSISDTPGEHALISARSKHGGVVNVCYGDGHVSTVADSINLAVWRALGTRALSERVDVPE
jgi:prepilin-type processing-associated H-X9-DG protein